MKRQLSVLLAMFVAAFVFGASVASWAQPQGPIQGPIARLPRDVIVGAQWSGWESLGGALVSAPTCLAPAENRLECYARSSDGTLQRKLWSGTAWSAWQSLPGVPLQSYDDGAGAGPSCVRDNGGTTHCFVWGADNALWHRWFPQTGSGWWENLGGSLTAAPSCTAAPDALTISCFGRGQNGALWQRMFDGNVWGPWIDRGGSIVAGTNPACVARAAGRVDCVVVGAGNTLFHGIMSGGAPGWRQISGNQVLSYGALPVSPRCHESLGAVACYVPRGPSPTVDTFSALRARLDGATWGVSDLDAGFGYSAVDLSCLDGDDRQSFECFALLPGGSSAFGGTASAPRLRTFTTSLAAPSTGWRDNTMPTPPTNNPSIHRLNCVSWAPGRIDCFATSSAGGPMMHIWRTPNEPLRRYPRPY